LIILGLFAAIAAFEQLTKVMNYSIEDLDNKSLPTN